MALVGASRLSLTIIRAAASARESCAGAGGELVFGRRRAHHAGSSSGCVRHDARVPVQAQEAHGRRAGARQTAASAESAQFLHSSLRF